MPESQPAPKLQKWPFYLADIVLSGIAAFLLSRMGAISDTTQVVMAVACLLAAAWGAWLSITPWLLEFRTRSAAAENLSLKGTLEQIQDLEKVADLIRQSNAQWQGVQDASARTIGAAREIAERMKTETEEFSKFIENAHDQERSGLRLEVEKLRKMEGDWIKVSVQILDHVFALFRAAERSGQQQLIQQLAQFQAACRDAARRMGLTPFIPAHGERYDARGHQLPEPPPVIDENATIAEVLATGFTYQGQLLRRALVLLEQSSPTEPSATLAEETVKSDREEVPMFVEIEPPLTNPNEDERSETNTAENLSEPSKRSRPAPDPEVQNELPLV